ncbi:MAG TPA: toprim domain-containing protein [Rhodospirillales bacterium]|nr:toprim domain-containing protein [Rhodospirillales bacterium]
MREAPADDVVALTEGIEDGLSVAMAWRETRVLAAVSISNLAAIVLPPQLVDLVVYGDNDPSGSAAARQLEQVIAVLSGQGRAVGVARMPAWAKDVNGYLMRSLPPAPAAAEPRSRGAAGMSIPEDDDKVVRLAAIRAAGEQAREGRVRPPAAGAGHGRGGDAAKKKRRDGLPDDCPVTALGRDGGVFYYLDPLRQVRDIPARFHGRGEIQGLFSGHIEYLQAKWPRFAKGGEINGIRYDDVAMALMQACSKVGIWAPAARASAARAAGAGPTAR